MKQTIYRRWQQDKIIQALSTRRVLLLTGPRQSGKTTLAREISVPDTIYRTLDDLTLLEAALSDPLGFVSHSNQLMIIDEVQRAPMLLRAIKQDVDENQEYGRFLLTGSTNIQSMPTVQESLAGRIRKIRLRPLALGEVQQTRPNLLANIFSRTFAAFVEDRRFSSVIYDKDLYISQALTGGFPEVLRMHSENEKRQWHKDYLSVLIEHDLKDIAQIRRKDGLNKLIEVLAAWSAKYIDISAIGSSLSLSRPTLDNYINALEALYLVERVRPWHNTDYDRVSRQDKLFMTDTGLMGSILRWRFDHVRLNGQQNGKLMETFVYNQLAAILEADNKDYFLYHYRDREKREIDFMIENEDGNLLGLEVKSGAAVTKSSFKHLCWFRDHIAKDRIFTGIVLYTGREILSFEENMWAVPIHCLWT